MTSQSFSAELIPSRRNKLEAFNDPLLTKVVFQMTLPRYSRRIVRDLISLDGATLKLDAAA
jgi:hypothetical protein